MRFFARVVGFLDAADVGDGFAIGWHGFELVDALRAGVVGGEGEDEIVVVTIEKFAKIFCSGFDVFLRVENIPDTETRGGPRQKLHEAARIFARDGFGIEFGFGRDNADDEVGVNSMVLCSGRNETPVRNIGERGFRRGVKNLFRFDGDNFGCGDFCRAAGELEFVGITDELIAGDNEALAVFQDDIFSASGLREERRGEQHEKKESEEPIGRSAFAGGDA